MKLRVVCASVAAGADAVRACNRGRRAGLPQQAHPPGRGRRSRRRAGPARHGLVAQKLGDGLGQQVIVDNRAGAGGALGAETRSRSRTPDGYTLLLTTTAVYAILPNLRKDLPYDPVSDFVPIARIATASNVLVVNVELPAQVMSPSSSSYAKDKPGALNYASAGVGTPGAPRRRDAEPARRHQGHARPLQGRRAGAARRDRRQRAVHHHLADRRRRAHERGPRARDRDDRHRAQSSLAGPADGRRYRCPATRSRSRGASSRPPVRRPDVVKRLRRRVRQGARERRDVKDKILKTGAVPPATGLAGRVRGVHGKGARTSSATSSLVRRSSSRNSRSCVGGLR